MVAHLGQTAHNGTIPSVTEASFRENAGATLQLGTFSGPADSALDVGPDYEVAHALSRRAPADIREDAVKVLELLRTIGIARHDPAILPEYSEIEVGGDLWDYDERWPGRRGRQLPECII